MYLAISHDDVVLHQPEVVTDVYASHRERLTAERIAAVLAEHDAGRLAENLAQVLVPLATLRRLAAGRVPEGWDADFERMVAGARERGLLTDDGEAITAPLEREM